MTFLQNFRSRAVLASAAVYLLVSLICTRIPLVNYLGYEFSVVIAVVATGVAGFLSIMGIRAVYRDGVKESHDVVRETDSAFLNTLVLNLLLLSVPLVVMAFNALFVRNCALLEGLGFFMLIPVVTSVVSCSLGFFCAAHYRFSRMSYLLCFSGTIVYALALGYWTPAIFSYNFFYGYFPGVTYDEILRLGWPLVSFRILTLFVAVLLALLARIIVRTSRQSDSTWQKGMTVLRTLTGPRVRVFAATAAAILIVCYVFRCELGFESTDSYIQHVLGCTVVTEHVTIYYDSSSFSGDEIRWTAAEHEFRLAQAWDAFVLPHRGRVTSYVYPSAAVKQRLIGAGTTSIAKPWRNEIHITRQTVDGTVKHELLHVVAGGFGVPVIHASLSAGLVEGLPMALEGEWGTRTLHEYAAAIRRAGIMPDMQQLMSIYGFATQSSSVSYVLAGSFCRYLIDRFGMRKLVQVYGQSGYETVYGRTLGQLLTDWKGYLDRIPEQPGDGMMVDASFRRPPIFRKVCARVLANRNEQARNSLAEKDYPRAEELFAASYADGHSYESLSGWLVSALREGKFGVLSAVYDTTIAVDPRPAEYLPLFLLIGDAYWAQGRGDRAFVLYDSMQRANLSRGLTDAALCRMLAMRNEHHAALLSYMLSDAPDSLRLMLLDSLSVLAPNDGLMCFLQGKTLLRLQRFDDALKRLRGFELGDIDVRLEASRRIAVGEALFRLRRFQEAKASFWLSLNNVYSSGAKALVDQWIERCDWMSEHGPK
jgi:tetratricopeptide (TPR) repeat protein